MVLSLVWSGYYALHSLLAADSVKGAIRRFWPRLARWYRLGYNVLALILLPVPLALTQKARGELIWAWPGSLGLVADLAAGAAVLGFVASLFAYDLGAFSGLRPNRAGPDTVLSAPLRISTFHRFVRHPWYFFGLVILWSRDMDRALLATVLVTTVYFIVGSRLEESRLIREHGERYRAYRRAVPALLPRPWRTLSASEARQLQDF